MKGLSLNGHSIFGGKLYQKRGLEQQQNPFYLSITQTSPTLYLGGHVYDKILIHGASYGIIAIDDCDLRELAMYSAVRVLSEAFGAAGFTRADTSVCPYGDIA